MKSIPPQQNGMCNWTDSDACVATFLRVLRGFVGKEVDVLELGSYEGRSARGFLALLGEYARVTCVDSWADYDELPEIKMAEVEQVFDQNMAGYPIVKIKQHTVPALAELLHVGAAFNVIYVDASHKSLNVLQDAALAWPLLTTGGIMIFDDYQWHSVALAAAAFIHAMDGQALVVHKDYRLFVQKT